MSTVTVIMRTWLWTVLFLTGIIVQPVVIARLHKPHSIPCSRLVVFGDSLSDDGVEMGRSVSHGFIRNSNGPVWAEYLSQLLDCDQYDNYAYSGAKSGMDNFYFTGWSGLLWQIDNFVLTNPSLSEDVIIVVQCGGAIDFFTGDNNTEEVAENLRRGLENLQPIIAGGDSSVIVLNLADLSGAPGIQAAEHSGQLKQRISSLVAETNMKIRHVMFDIKDGLKTTYPEARMRLFDLNSVMTEAISRRNTSVPFSHHHAGTQSRHIYSYSYHDLWNPGTFVHYAVAQGLVNYLQDSL